MTITAHAQVTFVQKETRGGQSTTSQIQIDKDHIRADTHNENDEVAFVFDAASKTGRIINISKKTYMEISQAEMEQMRTMMAQVQEQLRNMPPDQRAQVEQMMQGRGMPGLGAALPKVNYRQAGSDKVGQWTCAKYEGFVAEQKTSEVCTVDPKDLGLVASDFEAARQLAELFKTFVPDAAAGAFVNGTPNDQGFSGVPFGARRSETAQLRPSARLLRSVRDRFPRPHSKSPLDFKSKRRRVLAPRDCVADRQSSIWQ
jgi:hypothetical protein